GSFPAVVNGFVSPEESFTRPRVSLNMAVLDPPEPRRWSEGSLMSTCGRNRNTGLEVIELRRTHFQSSLINVPEVGLVEISSIELRRVARLMANMLRMPG